MSEITELNKSLVSTSKQISVKSNEVEKARIEYLSAKDEHEKDYSLAIVKIKTENPKLTQTDIKAMAIEQSYQKKLDMRTKEGAYRKLVTDLKALRDTLKSLQEVAYNIRAEIRLTNTINP